MSEGILICPNCGSKNRVGDHFCSNCGSRLPSGNTRATTPSEESTATTEPSTTSSTPIDTSIPLPPAQQEAPTYFPPPVTPTFGRPQEEVGEDWKMSSLGPPPRPKRSIWLWVLIGIVAICLLACVGMAIFVNTDAGQDWLHDLETQVATIQATEEP